MSPELVDVLDRLANVVLGTASFLIATLIAIATFRRATRTFAPLGVVFLVVFVAIGVRALTRVLALEPGAGGQPFGGLLVAVEWLQAAAAVAFLSLHRRYGVFIESAAMVSEYETEYAAKEREAQALVQVNEELRRLDELKSEFLAMVSHELRTPLTAIVGYSRLLMRQVHGSLTAKQLEQQEAILRSAQRLTDLINDLLDVSRLEAGRVELQPRPTSLRQIADQVIAVVSAAAHGKQIRVQNDVPADLPHLNADPTRLQQILVNLVGNAVKFTPSGGLVRIAAGTTGEQAWVAVEDTGVGIPGDELARIWDPFYQVESPLRRRHGGSGLGLTIVRRLVELHGGVVRAESQGANKGSRFTFTLPVARDAGTEVPEQPVAARIERVLAGRNVLIVEDEPDNQALMRSVIEDILGGKATVCEDGERAIHEALEQPPAIVLLDLMLPRVSGWEVARRLRQSPRTREVPIVAVSALARAQEREAAVHAGCDAYIAKPFTPEDMARVISGALGRQGAAA
ncbi:MAG: response regulator [Candidatus Rokubacteria bacterium]|nr:response regulator [Candidatus Rokubacteria bacterium]